MSWHRATDGLIVIRSVKLSNHGATAHTPKGCSGELLTGAMVRGRDNYCLGEGKIYGIKSQRWS
jgi:hypothetical protein